MDYSRQIVAIGKKNHEQLREKRAAIVGCGGLGNFSSLLLCLSGINLVLIDHDNVGASNLHRCPLFSERDIGKNKAEVLAKRLREHNPGIDVTYITKKAREEHIRDVDIVLDCTDTFATKYLLNSMCIKMEIPLVYASVSGYDGQVMFIHKSACLRCFIPNGSDNPCGVVGAIPAVVSMISSVQVMQVINFFIGGKVLKDEVFIYNAKRNAFYTVEVKKREDCKDCGTKENAMDFLTIQPCKAKAAFSIIPKKMHVIQKWEDVDKCEQG
ncbi:MAG: HesA/MoeB/ThiF family protein [Candidatus Diapherotrites archaeon]|nr:HesA/MoeB/ThiF family protein [Candidatus Diapherotrites archaeon]